MDNPSTKPPGATAASSLCSRPSGAFLTNSGWLLRTPEVHVRVSGERGLMNIRESVMTLVPPKTVVPMLDTKKAIYREERMNCPHR